MDPYSIQESLFERIKSKIGDSRQWVDDIAQTLSLSKPAVYKRINGTTSLSIGDLAQLMKAYDISFDSLIHTDKLTVDFTFPKHGNQIKSFLDFLQPKNPLFPNYHKYLRLKFGMQPANYIYSIIS